MTITPVDENAIITDLADYAKQNIGDPPGQLIAGALSVLLDRTDPHPEYTFTRPYDQASGVVWENSGPDGDEDASRLSATGGILVAGVPMHLEAYEVTVDDNGIQTGAGDEPEGREWSQAALDAICTIYEPDGPFRTTTINGREYVLVAFPFSS